MNSLTTAERQVLADLEVCSHGTTSSYQPVATKSGAASKDPPSADGPHIRYKSQLLATDDPDRREAILRNARDELREHRRRCAPQVESTESSYELDTRITKKLTEGWTVSEIALACRVTPTRVRQAAASGKTTKEDRSIRTLAEQGHSVRFIAMRLGIAKSTVHDSLRRAA